MNHRNRYRLTIDGSWEFSAHQPNQIKCCGAEIWGAAIAAAAALGGGAMAANASKKAGSAAAAGSNAAIAEQQRQFNTVRSDTAPYRTMGTQALNALGRLYGFAPAAQPQSFEEWSAANPIAAAPPAKKKHSGGLLGHMLNPLEHVKDTVSSIKSLNNGDIKGALDPGHFLTPEGKPVAGANPQQAYQEYLQTFNYSPTTTGGPGYKPTPGGGVQPITQAGPEGAPEGGDMSGFFMSPDYNFRMTQGNQAVERSAAARGGLVSGNTGAALQDYGQGLASTEFGNFYNRLANLAGIGQSGVAQSASAGGNAANNIGAYEQNAANSRASGIADSANSWGNALGSLGGIAYDQFGRKKPQPIGGGGSNWGSQASYVGG